MSADKMTVGQLREALLAFDQEMPVAVLDQYSGADFYLALTVFKVDPEQPLNHRAVGLPIRHIPAIEDRMIDVLVVS